MVRANEAVRSNKDIKPKVNIPGLKPNIFKLLDKSTQNSKINPGTILPGKGGPDPDPNATTPENDVSYDDPSKTEDTSFEEETPTKKIPWGWIIGCVAVAGVIGAFALSGKKKRRK